MLTFIVIIFFLYEGYMIKEQSIMTILCTGVLIYFLIWEFIEIFKLIKWRNVEEELLDTKESNNILGTQIRKELKKSAQYSMAVNKNFKLEDGVIVLRLCFPEIRNDSFLQIVINEYCHNNRKIKELERKKEEFYISKWLVYFGV